jgi:hypothetical protein
VIKNHHVRRFLEVLGVHVHAFIETDHITSNWRVLGDGCRLVNHSTALIDVSPIPEEAAQTVPKWQDRAARTFAESAVSAPAGIAISVLIVMTARACPVRGSTPFRVKKKYVFRGMLLTIPLVSARGRAFRTFGLTKVMVKGSETA